MNFQQGNNMFEEIEKERKISRASKTIFLQPPSIHSIKISAKSSGGSSMISYNKNPEQKNLIFAVPM